RRVDLVGQPGGVGTLVPALGVDLRAKPALLELGLDAVGVPRLDAERDVIDARPLAARRRRCRAVGRQRSAAAGADVADVAHQALVLTALVVGFAPAEQVAIEPGALLVVGGVERKMIEPDRLPCGSP